MAVLENVVAVASAFDVKVIVNVSGRPVEALEVVANCAKHSTGKLFCSAAS